MTVTFSEHTIESAPEGSRAALSATAAKFGFVPSAMARLAESPSAVAMFGRMMAVWDATSLSHAEREVVAMTTAGLVGCHVCIALHSAILAGDPATRDLAGPLGKGGALADPRLEALRRFARSVIESRGAAGDDDLARFLAAGYSRAQALEVVVGVATYTFTAYSNRLTRAAIDAPFRR